MVKQNNAVEQGRAAIAITGLVFIFDFYNTKTPTASVYQHFFTIKPWIDCRIESQTSWEINKRCGQAGFYFIFVSLLI